MTELYQRPEQEILLLGEMMRENKLIDLELKKLPFSQSDYRSGLRIIAGACARIRATCVELLDDEARANMSMGEGDLLEAMHHSTPAAGGLDPEPAQPSSPPETNGRKRLTKPAIRLTKQPKSETAAAEPETPMNEKVLAVLKKGPHSPKDLVEKTGLQFDQMYRVTHALKVAGKIVNRFDESGGEKRWFLQGKG